MLVHGFMDAAGTWDLVAPALAAKGLRVLAPDMRGFGDGARAPKGSYYHFVDYVFDLADLVDALSPGEPIALVGHSMGGTIATLFAGTFPERVARLAIVEGVGPPDNPFEVGPDPHARLDRAGARVARARQGQARVLARRMRCAGWPPIIRTCRRRCSRTGCLTSRRTRARGASRGTSIRCIARRRPMPFFAKLFVEFAKKVTCPVLFVSGGPRGYHPPDEDERLAAFATLAARGAAGRGAHGPLDGAGRAGAAAPRAFSRASDAEAHGSRAPFL